MVPTACELVGDDPPYFQPCQIVCLQHAGSCLYGEVVQIIESRHLCWVRPMVLVLQPAEALKQTGGFCEQSHCYDLRQDSDLLLPLTLFRAALDTEVLPWLSDFYVDDRPTVDLSSSDKLGHDLFRTFIQQVWQAHTEIFQKRSDLSKL
jgi:hypothetical protein